MLVYMNKITLSQVESTDNCKIFYPHPKNKIFSTASKSAIVVLLCKEEFK